MAQLTTARLQLAGVLAVSAALVLLPLWLRQPDGGVEDPQKRQSMPRFSYPTLDGATWSLREQKGKIIFLNFWASWCGPCRDETPGLVRVYTRYRLKGIEFAAVSMDDDPTRVAPAFVKHYRVNYPILVPPIESALTAAIQSLPTSFLIDASGKIARTWIGAVREHDLSLAIDKLLLESARLSRIAEPNAGASGDQLSRHAAALPARMR